MMAKLYCWHEWSSWCTFHFCDASRWVVFHRSAMARWWCIFENECLSFVYNKLANFIILSAFMMKADQKFLEENLTTFFMNSCSMQRYPWSLGFYIYKRDSHEILLELSHKIVSNHFRAKSATSSWVCVHWIISPRCPEQLLVSWSLGCPQMNDLEKTRTMKSLPPPLKVAPYS